MKNKKLRYSILFLLLLTVGLSVGIFSPTINRYRENIETPKASDGEITLITPDNKTYTQPDIGYYPATYGFENEVDGSTGTNIDFVDIDDSDGGCYVEIRPQYNKHKKILALIDDGLGMNHVSAYPQFSSQEYGTMECWLWNTGDPYNIYTEFWNGASPLGGLRTGSDWVRYDDGGWVVISGAPTPVAGTWNHIRIDFRCGATEYMGLNQWDFQLWINGEVYGPYTFASNLQPNRQRFSTMTSGGGAYTTYADAVGYSWDPNYNIGDNLNEGLLLSYDNTTNLNWQEYSLDGSANKTILGNTTIPMPADGGHNIQVFGNNSIGTMYESNKRFFSVDTSPYINVITPENKTYVDAMSGYYPATYGFENDENGSNPMEWEVTENGGTIDVVSSIGGHSKIVEFSKDGITSWPHMRNNFSTSQTSGTVEFWIRSNDVTDQSLVYLSRTDKWMITIGIDNDHFVWIDSSGLQNIVSCYNNVWYHIRIDFECGSGAYEGLSADHFYIYINGGRYGEYEFRNSGDSMDYIDIFVWETSVDYYYDAIGYSWDPNYTVGDNTKEGLLLGYNTNFDTNWTGFSLDNASNRTILGNKTIPMPVDGTHNIRVFGNDTMGTMYESNLRYFTLNTAPPDITINSPTDSQVIGSTAPSYDISIAGPYDSIWYALEGGTNYTASGLAGTIDQSAWSALSDGIITIDFYANNSAGMEGTAQVQVIKDSSVESPYPGIPGYDLYILIGALSVISVLLIGKRVKS